MSLKWLLSALTDGVSQNLYSNGSKIIGLTNIIRNIRIIVFEYLNESLEPIIITNAVSTLEMLS